MIPVESSWIAGMDYAEPKLILHLRDGRPIQVPDVPWVRRRRRPRRRLPRLVAEGRRRESPCEWRTGQSR